MNTHLIKVLETQRARAVSDQANRKEEMAALWTKLVKEHSFPSYEVERLYSLVFNEGADTQKVIMIDSQLRDLRRESSLKKLFNKLLKK